LNEICIYNKRGPYKGRPNIIPSKKLINPYPLGTYELKPKYKVDDSDAKNT
jgi:hypothetical protein